MAEPNILITLRRKRDEIDRAILNYERRLEEARHDLAHVNACITVFAADGPPGEAMPYHDLGRLFRRGEIGKLCKAALEAQGPLDTRELALHVIRTKGMEEGDRQLRLALAYRVVQVMTVNWKRGLVDSPGKRNNVRLWATIKLT